MTAAASSHRGCSRSEGEAGPRWYLAPRQSPGVQGWMLSSLHFNLQALGVWKKLFKSSS